MAQPYDTQAISSVETTPSGFALHLESGWSCFMPNKTMEGKDVQPKIGDTVSFYGKGLGFQIRGMALNNDIVFYRSEEEFERYHNELMYGATAADWVNKWDTEGHIWSIEMGGLGPSYEQAIQLLVVEIVRWLVGHSENVPLDEWKDRINKEVVGVADRQLKLTWTQAGAALSLAFALFNDTPVVVFTNEKIKDRRIQVSKHFPTLDMKLAATL